MNTPAESPFLCPACRWPFWSDAEWCIGSHYERHEPTRPVSRDGGPHE